MGETWGNFLLNRSVVGDRISIVAYQISRWRSEDCLALRNIPNPQQCKVEPIV